MPMLVQVPSAAVEQGGAELLGPLADVGVAAGEIDPLGPEREGDRGGV